MALSASEIYRDFVVNGVPSSGSHKPSKADIRNWGTWIESFASAIGAGGGSVYFLRSDLFLDLQHAANDMAWVLQDPTVSYNGIYRKNGGFGTGSWTRVGDLPYSFTKAVNNGLGTANAIQAVSDLPVSESALVVVTVGETNTASPVTISFNGAAPLTVKTASLLDVPIGGLPLTFLGSIQGSEFRLASDVASASLQASVEAVYVSFQSQFLGSHASSPSADPNGNPLIEGAFYFNTVIKTFFYWDGDSWEAFPYATVLDGSVTEAKLDSVLKGKITTALDAAVNFTVMALEIADLKGSRFGMIGGIADAFDDQTGVDAGASINQAYDTAGQFKPTFEAGSNQIPTMTAATTSGVSIDASNSNTATGFQPWHIGDKVGTTSWVTQNGTTSGWVRVDLGSGNEKSIAAYSILQRPSTLNQAPRDWTLEGSNNGTTWTSLDARSGETAWTEGVARTFIVSSPASFRYYRLNVTAVQTGGIAIGVAELSLNIAIAPNNMTLTSVAYSASAVPSKARVALQLADSLSLVAGTDFSFEVSRDGGTTWSLVPLTLSNPSGFGSKIYEGTVSISSQPSGSVMKWRMKTLTNKVVIASGVVLQWS